MMTKPKLTSLAAAFGVFIAAVAVWLYVGELLAYPSLSHFHGPMPFGDFRSFWAPARLVWLGEAYGAYNPDIMTPMMATFMEISSFARIGPMYYPPTYLLVLAPFGLLEFFSAAVAFFASTLLLFIVTLRVITGRWWFALFMLCFAGIWINLVTGQNGLLTASLFGLGFAMVPANPVLAGLFFGLLTFKPHLGVLIPVALLACRRYDVIKWAALTFAGLFLLTNLLFGWDIWIWGLTGMFSASYNIALEPRLWARIPSAFAFLRLSGLSPFAALLMQVGLMLSVMILTWGIWRHCRNHNLNVAATASAALLVAPFMYDYDMPLLGVAVAFLGLEIARTGWWWAERLVLPLALLWPMVVSWATVFTGHQIGLLGPVLLMLVAVRRILKEVAVAARPAIGLNRAA